jgi:hypothetical protein
MFEERIAGPSSEFPVPPFELRCTIMEALYTRNGIITQMNISITYTVQFIIRPVPADVTAMFLHRPTAVADNSQPTFPL